MQKNPITYKFYFKQVLDCCYIYLQIYLQNNERFNSQFCLSHLINDAKCSSPCILSIRSYPITTSCYDFSVFFLHHPCKHLHRVAQVTFKCKYQGLTAFQLGFRKRHQYTRTCVKFVMFSAFVYIFINSIASEHRKNNEV